MGVDTNIKVRIYSTGESAYHEVEVAPQGNALRSLFTTNEIADTTVPFDKDQELLPHEAVIFNLLPNESDGLREESSIVEAKQAVRILEKIDRILYRRKSDALMADLARIDKLEISEDEKREGKYNVISDYLVFEQSFGALHGILKVASELNCKIQIVSQGY